MIRFFRVEMVRAPGLPTKATVPSPGKWGQPRMPHAWATERIQFICFLLFTLIFLMTTTGLLGSLCFLFLVIIMQKLSRFASKFSLLLLLLQLAASESQHICVSYRIPELAQFWGPTLGCCVQFRPFAPAEGCQISWFSSNLPPAGTDTGSWPHRSHLAAHLTTCHMLSIHSFLKCLLSTFFVPGTVLVPASMRLTI